MSPTTVSLLRPLFRFSPMRDAYVLRLVGRSIGPVLVERPRLDRPRSAAR